jgi:hypothetical protein
VQIGGTLLVISDRMPTVVQQRAFSVHFPWVYRAVLGAQAARDATFSPKSESTFD